MKLITHALSVQTTQRELSIWQNKLKSTNSRLTALLEKTSSCLDESKLLKGKVPDG